MARDNKKFLYGLVREGARAREYEEAMLWLLDSGLLRKVGRITKAAAPLKAYEDLKSFKLYHLDVGLLNIPLYALFSAFFHASLLVFLYYRKVLLQE